MDRINVKIDKTAEVAPEAELGAGSEIGPYCQIGPGVELGENTVLGSRIEITGRTRLGDNNQVFTGAILGQAASYSNRRKQLDGVGKDENFDLIIGDNNIIREYSVIYGSNKIGVEKQPTIIGDDNFLMAYNQIKPGARLGSGITIANSSVIDEGCQIGDQAFLAGLAYIPEEVKIGRLSMVGACARIVDSLPPFLLADGNPAGIESIN
ncbi:MAG: acyl-[acyl-carrier-protein]--UDP-N-acetylglucosamine O-acyltransferase, partial [Halarsenatibacteraceae bacterium]